MAITSPRATARDFRIAPPAFYGDIERSLQEAVPDPGLRRPLQDIFRQMIEWQLLTNEVVNGLMAGRHNGHGTVTLTANQATTTLADRRISANTKVILMSTTANAAAEVAAGGLFQTYPNVAEGAVVINQANNAQVDRDFVYVLAG